uniref:NADH dehydrogenase subunit 2 n=1 Tax=Auricularia delicata TaxID=160860 RepID=UPI002079B7A5|nr:NADH dehydrogenase subunit 2 [Auricularia delicata]URP31150.1 NADH dehydrogenase subunit 2 [Auricularia delicata]
MYLSIELQSFGLYILATLYKEKLSATSAGLKYFLLGGLSSCIILLGSGLIYTYTGLTNLELIYTLISIYFNNYSDYGAISLLNTVPEVLTLDSQNLFNALRAGVIDSLSSYIVGSEVPFYENIFLINDKLKGIGIGVLLIFSGFLFKIAASPFHNWAPDVYDDSPTLVTTWLTIMPKISILIFLLQLLIGIDVYLNLFSIGISQTINNYNLSGTNFEQILNLLFDNLVNILYKASDIQNSLSAVRGLDPSLPSVNILTNLLLLSSLLSLIIGAIVGLSQIRIKRLLAYSTINHIGFLLLALSVFSNSSIEAFIFYIIQYTITNLNIFLIILALSYIINHSIDISYFNYGLENLRPTSLKEGGAKKYIKFNISDIEYINSFKGLFYKNPILSLSFSICLFSFAGVPPLIGFFAKQQVLYSSNSAGYFFLSLIAIIVSVISAFYYLKIIKIIFSVNAAPSRTLQAAISTNQAMPLKDLPSVDSGKINNKHTTLSYPSSALNVECEAGEGDSLINGALTLKNGQTHKALGPSTNPSSNALGRVVRGFEGRADLVGLNTNLAPRLSNVHSFIIGTLTISIMIFILNPELLLNSIAIITSLILNL